MFAYSCISKIDEVGFSDHNIVIFGIGASIRNNVAVHTHSYWDLKNINLVEFGNLLVNSSVCHSPAHTVDEYFDQFKTDVNAALDVVAPSRIFTGRVSQKSAAVWMSSDARTAKKCS